MTKLVLDIPGYPYPIKISSEGYNLTPADEQNMKKMFVNFLKIFKSKIVFSFFKEFTAFQKEILSHIAKKNSVSNVRIMDDKAIAKNIETSYDFNKILDAYNEMGEYDNKTGVTFTLNGGIHAESKQINLYNEVNKYLDKSPAIRVKLSNIVKKYHLNEKENNELSFNFIDPSSKESEVEVYYDIVWLIILMKKTTGKAIPLNRVRNESPNDEEYIKTILHEVEKVKIIPESVQQIT
jgi:hypothetical protein